MVSRTRSRNQTKADINKAELINDFKTVLLEFEASLNLISTSPVKPTNHTFNTYLSDVTKLIIDLQNMTVTRYVDSSQTEDEIPSFTEGKSKVYRDYIASINATLAKISSDFRDMNSKLNKVKSQVKSDQATTLVDQT